MDMRKENEARLPVATMRGLGETLLAVNPNQSPVDAYTLFHAGFGVMMREAGVSLPVTVASSLVWEYVIEPFYKDRNPEIFPVPSQDSFANRTFDTLAVVAGWALMRRQ